MILVTRTVDQTRQRGGVCVCCVFFPFILDVRLCGRTSRGHTEFLIHLPSAAFILIFLARRIQPFLSLVDREVEFSTCWTLFILLHFIFL